MNLRRLIFIGVSVLSFSLGCTVVRYLISEENLVEVSPVEIIHEIKFSDLMEDPTRYIGKTVRFRGFMFERRFVYFHPPNSFDSLQYDFEPNAVEAWQNMRPVFEDKTPYIPHVSQPCLRALVTVTGKIEANDYKKAFNSFEINAEGKVIGKDRDLERGLDSRFWIIIDEIENVEKCPVLTDIEKFKAITKETKAK